MPESINISEVVSSFYSELKTVATDLNAASDELGKAISEIDEVLRKLNLGITVWVVMREECGDEDQGDYSFWTEKIGYAKHSGRWGICLREVSGERIPGTTDMVDTWLFSDAPRTLRLTAIDHIVGLLQKLSEEGRATTQKIKDKLVDAQAVASAVTSAAAAQAPRLRMPIKPGALLRAAMSTVKAEEGVR